MAVNREYILAPEISPLPFGLYSVAPPTEKNESRWGFGVEYESANCASANFAPDPCIQSGTNEVQTATTTGTITAGTYTLSIFGETTAPIAYNATNAQVQTALEALTLINTNDVVVTGTAASRVFTFGGQYAAEDVPQLVIGNSTLVGGTIAMATTTGGVRTPKVANSGSPGVLTFDPATLLVMLECVGPADFLRAKDRAVAAMVAAEQRGTEASLWEDLTAVGRGVTVINSTAQAIDTGIAQAEIWAAQNYGGAPVLHVPRDVGSLMGTRGVAERHGNRLETVQGALVASGGGYSKTGPEAAAAVAGQAWIFVTGQTRVRRGPMRVYDPVMIQSPMDNTFRVMAERTVLVDTDCMVGALRVNVA